MDKLNDVQKIGIMQKTIDFKKAGKTHPPKSVVKVLFGLKQAEIFFLQNSVGCIAPNCRLINKAKIRSLALSV